VSIFLFIVLVGSVVFWLYFINRYDKLRPEPMGAIIKVLLVAGFLSTLLAGFLNSGFAALLGFDLMGEYTNSVLKSFLFSAFVGLNEEFFKFLFTYVMVRSLKEFDEPIDGLIYGMTGGLGFAFFENIDYGLMGGTFTAIIRNFSAVPLHIAVAAVWGIGLSKARFSGEQNPNYILHSKNYILIAAGIHALYDFLLFASEGTPLSGYMFFVSVAIAFITLSFAVKKLKEFAPHSAIVNEQERLRKESFTSHEDGSFSGEHISYCRYCGTKRYAEDALYCHNCGKPLN